MIRLQNPQSTRQSLHWIIKKAHGLRYERRNDGVETDRQERVLCDHVLFLYSLALSLPFALQNLVILDSHACALLFHTIFSSCKQICLQLQSILYILLHAGATE
jgi:hypothetical protein